LSPKLEAVKVSVLTHQIEALELKAKVKKGASFAKKPQK